MAIATAMRQEDWGLPPERREELRRRAEECLRRARMWGDWMEAAERCRDRFDSAIDLKTAQGPAGCCTV